MSNRRRTLRLPLRRPRMERLEGRRVLSGDQGDWDQTLPWSEANSLTLSFAPDGTRIGQHTSSLFATLGNWSSREWQDAVVGAFQTWARTSNINVGVVKDDGSPFGTAAPNYGDPRFGDVRLGAVPMSLDSLAVAIPHDDPVAGSWSGDVLFNSEVNFASIDEVFAVALHEIGHVLGLGHSADPQSPMYETLDASRRTPSAADLQALQGLYGSRAPDLHEEESGNDTLDRATRIKYADEAEEGAAIYDGSTPLVVYGDVGGSADTDLFRLDILPGYTGPVTVRIVTAGISQLAPHLTLLSRRGQVLESVAVLAGQDATLVIPAATDGKYYLQIDGPESGLADTGAYALVATFDARLTVSQADITRVVRAGRRITGLDQEEISEADTRRMFQNPQQLPTLDDDSHTDDDPGSGVTLAPVGESARLSQYRIVASLSDANDKDYYRLELSETSAGTDLLLRLQSLDVDGLIPRLGIVDDAGNEVPLRVLANGLGQFVARAEGVARKRPYFIRVEHAANAASFTTGNYELNVIASVLPLDLTVFAHGSLPADRGHVEHSLLVARSQLFSLALESSASGGVVWATVYDDHQRPVHLIAGEAGETRSATSVLLDPGAYTVVFGAQGAPSGTTLDYSLVGTRLDEPIGPPLVDSTATQIYSCTDLSGLFCFPGPVVTSIPILVIPVPTPTIPFPSNVNVQPPADKWYWQTNPKSTNLVNPLDVNNDSSVTPLDALVVINDLNTHGARQLPPPPVQSAWLDTNEDGFVSPLDVLVVINELNRAAVGEGEGASVATLENLTQSLLVMPATGNGSLVQSADVNIGGGMTLAPITPGGHLKRKILQRRVRIELSE